MPGNDSKFFTNEPGKDLYSRFNKVLQTNTQFFDILVGYFRTSGFFNLYKAMESVEHIRVLVGLNVDKYTVDIIDAANLPSTAEAEKEFSNEVEDEFKKSDVNEEVSEGVRKFIEWLKCGKMEMRMYIKAPLHAKVYVMRKDQSLCDYKGIVVTGSSNFSEAGLKGNLEFNVELRDDSDVTFALDQFEKLWNDSVPIDKTYIDAVEQKTWLRNDITPYDIYLKTLYEFFKEEINSDKEDLGKDLLPEGYMRLQYQIDAVVQARKILQAYNGVFISDVVGLGKTYICAMLAKSLPNSMKLVVCPPTIVNYWESVFLEFGVSAKVVSLGKLDSVLEDNIKYDYVFVDEAHRFRNDKTESYSKLHEICYGKKVVLISATPINNYMNDIENQIYLFQPKHNSNIAGVKNLELFFANLRSNLKHLKIDTPEYMAQVRKNSEQIRDKIIRHVMIRRTRTEIEKYYHDDLVSQHITFPKLGSPEPVEYVLDDDTDRIFTETMTIIKNFTYARYRPITYLKNTAEYSKELTAQQNMSGFMKSLLIKRLESSFHAFRMTLKRFIESHKKFIEMFESGDVWICKKVDVYDYLDEGNIDELMSIIEEKDGYHFKSSDFKENFIPHLKRDLSRLEYLYSQWDSVKDDPKLDAFKEMLKNDERLAGTKKIIFTESKETAEYLQENLAPIFGDRVVAYSSVSGPQMKMDIENSFDPARAGSGKDKYDVLITTDVLSEGVNLHRSNVIINYDLPWNPTRIMQRVGRINRIGTTFDRIYVFNFFPTAQSSKQMPLTERILEKLQAFHDTLGEDYRYLSDDEQIGTQKLFDSLTANLEEDEESTNPELAYLTVIRKVRDDDPNLFERIKKLPEKAVTGRYSNLIGGEATLTFIRKGALKSFYLTKEVSSEGAEQLTFIDAVKYLECEPDEGRIDVGGQYYKHYRQNSATFDNDLMLDEIVAVGKKPLKGNDAKMYKTLVAIRKEPTLTGDQEEVLDWLRKAYEDGDIPQNVTKNILKKLEGCLDNISAYYTIRDNIPDVYLGENRNLTALHHEKKTIILSCYLKGEESYGL